MNDIAIKAEEIRLSERARQALERGQRVLITRYGRPTGALLNWEKYSLVEPLLDLIEEGAIVSPEILITKEDIALARDLSQDDETTPAEEAMIEEMLVERDG
jgi:hypothetical protein